MPLFAVELLYSVKYNPSVPLNQVRYIYKINVKKQFFYQKMNGFFTFYVLYCIREYSQG